MCAVLQHSLPVQALAWDPAQAGLLISASDDQSVRTLDIAAATTESLETPCGYPPRDQGPCSAPSGHQPSVASAPVESTCTSSIPLLGTAAVQQAESSTASTAVPTKNNLDSPPPSKSSPIETPRHVATQNQAAVGEVQSTVAGGEFENWMAVGETQNQGAPGRDGALGAEVAGGAVFQGPGLGAGTAEVIGPAGPGRGDHSTPSSDAGRGDRDGAVSGAEKGAGTKPGPRPAVQSRAPVGETSEGGGGGGGGGKKKRYNPLFPFLCAARSPTRCTMLNDACFFG